jgi:hypothetical protein
MRMRWARGLSDAQMTLRASPWLAPVAPEVAARTFDVLEDLRRKGAPAPLETLKLSKRAIRRESKTCEKPRSSCVKGRGINARPIRSPVLPALQGHESEVSRCCEPMAIPNCAYSTK